MKLLSYFPKCSVDKVEYHTHDGWFYVFGLALEFSDTVFNCVQYHIAASIGVCEPLGLSAFYMREKGEGD